MLIVLAALFSLTQETEVVKPRHAAALEPALVAYSTAWLQLERDPNQALLTVDHLFSLRIGLRDRRLAFERFNGTTAKVVDFYPNYLRGRIRFVLAQKDPENAVTLLPAALGDFRASSEAGVKAADEYVRLVRAAIEKLKASPKSAEPASKPSAAEAVFREPWFKLIEDHKFKSARDLIDQKGGPLGPERRRDYVKDTEGECRKYVGAQLDAFLRAMELGFRPAQARPTTAEFSRLFELPAEGEILGSYPELDWARKERSVLVALRTTTSRAMREEYPAVLRGLLAQMIAAEPLEKSAENRWLRASSMLSVRYVEEVLGSLANQSKDANPEERHRLHEEAESVRAQWSEAIAKIPRDVLARNRILANPRRIQSLLEEFPVDVDELDHVSVEACFVSDTPDAALEHVISDLTKIRDLHGTRLPKDAARRLLTELVAATAAHEILAGKSVEDVTKGLQELGRSLALAGGAVDPVRYGPKIEKIFAALKG